MLNAGDEVVAGDDLYGASFRLFDKVYSRLGLQFTYADARDPAALAAAMGPRTRLCWIESPTNPLLRLADIRGRRQGLHRRAAFPWWSTTRS